MSDALFVRALAESDAETQGKFINEFYRLLKVACKGRDGNQLCYIADYLDSNGREFLKELIQFADMSVETRAKLETGIQELYRQKHDLEKDVLSLQEQRTQLLQ